MKTRHSVSSSVDPVDRGASDGRDWAGAVESSMLGLSRLERRVLVAITRDGPQPLGQLAERLGTTVLVVGGAARRLVTRGVAVRVPGAAGDGLPVLVASSGGTAIVRDALARCSEPLRGPS